MGFSAHGRWMISLLLLTGVAIPGVAAAPQPPAAAETGAAAGPLSAANAAQAEALAASSGQPVEVMADRTDWAQTFAEPQGGFEEDVYMEPQRVQQPSGSWVAVDPTLSVQPGGLVAPAAITTGLTMSDGGSGPLFTLSQGGDSLSVSSPFGALPVPSLSGPTATYANVLPAVNLLVSATPTGVQELVEVTSAAAAANPALASLTFPTATSGLSVTADTAGDLAAVASSGGTVFSAPVPQMWDSAGPQSVGGGPSASSAQPAAASAAAASATGPVPGDHVAALGVSAASASVALTTSASVLSGPSVVYPVFIDPRWDTSQSSDSPTWSDVQRNGLDSTGGGHWEYASSQFGGIRSGVACDPWNADGSCPQVTTYTTTRSFLNFPTPPTGDGFYDASFVDAQLQGTETWSWGCSPPGGPTPVEMYDTNDNGSNVKTTSSSGLTWESQPAAGNWNDSAAVEHGDTCPTGTVFLSARTAARAASHNNWHTLTLRLSASSTDENNLNQWSWKRFDASTMVLKFYWRNAPELPTQYGTQGAFSAQTGQTLAYDCSTSKSSPDWVSNNAPVWQAKIDDIDASNGDNTFIDGEFAWTNDTTGTSGTTDGQSDNSKGLAPGTLFQVQRSGSYGDEYEWDAYGTTLSGYNDEFGTPVPVLPGAYTSPSCYFQADNTAPSSPATVTGPSSLAVGAKGTYTFTAGAMDTGVNGGPDVNDIVGFYWGIDNAQPSTYVPASTIGATTSSATVTFIPVNTVAANIYVQPVDRAGNVFPVTQLVPFLVTPTVGQPGNIAELAWWKLNGSAADSATAAGEADADLTVSSTGASWGCPGSATTTPAGYTCSLALDGSSGHAYANRAVMGNDGSFSVSAWADPAGCGSPTSPQYCAVLSQGASTVSAFTLGYQRYGTANGTGVTCPCWIFAMPRQDAAGGEYTPSGSSSGWWVAAAPAGSPALSTWTQLTGVFDASHDQLQLYVDGGDGIQPGDGNTAATATAYPWSSPGNGKFRIGADWTSATNGPLDFFDGSVSDACVFYGVLMTTSAQQDVQDLYDNGSGDGCGRLYNTYP